MTREEKEKAIDALKISAPVIAVTPKEYNDYIQTLNKIMDWLEQEPCHFCSMIYPDTDVTDIVFGRGKYSDINFDSFITIDNEGKYCINIDPGDPYELGYLVDIKFCPYCGRRLPESEEKNESI